MKRVFQHIIILVALSVIIFSNGYGQSNNGQLPIQNFSRKMYKAQAQNWEITQGDDNKIYVANNGGLLEYNGEEWIIDKTVLSERTVRTVHYYNDTLYVGGNEDFGFLVKDKIGKWKYSSLVPKLNDSLKGFEDIWSIQQINGEILFQGHQYLFLLEQNRNTIRTILPPPINPEKRDSTRAEIRNSFVVNNHCFLSSRHVGLCELVNDQVIVISPLDYFKDKSISSVLYKNEKYLALTTKDGAFDMTPNLKDSAYTFELVESELNNSLKEYETYTAQFLPNGILSVCTWGKGLIFINEQGFIVNRITKDVGLIDDIVQCQFLDLQGNLWVGTSNGLAKIEINSSVSIYNDRNGLKGTVEKIIRFRDTIFAATHSGLFYLNTNSNTFVKTDVKAEVWGIDKVNIMGKDILLLALNDGIYELDRLESKLIYKCYPWMFVQDPVSEKVIIGLDNGLRTMTYDTIKKEWNPLDTIKSLEGVAVFDMKVRDNELWLGTNGSGIYKTDFNLDEDKITNYNSSHGLPKLSIVFEQFQNRQFLGTKKGLYEIENGKIKESSLLKELGFPVNDTILIHRMLEDDDGNLWMITHNQKHKYFDIGHVSNTDSLQWVNSQFSVISEELIHAIYHDNDAVSWLGGVQGVFKYDSKKHQKNLIDIPVYITSIRNNEDEDSIIAYGAEYAKNLVFSYEDNSIWFNVASPNFNGDKGNEYSFYLEGKDGKWTDWKYLTKKDYQNLSEGTYTFKVKARDFYGNVSKETVFSFSVSPPWYRTWWAYFLYLLSFIGIVVLAVKLSIKRVIKQNAKLEEIIEERTSEVVAQKEEIEKQKELVDEKNRDITDSIRYAERIQTAILPPLKSVENAFKDSFVLFKPKDIVSGDFYWMEEIEGAIYFAAVDCTGHGVPGAMVSVVGNNGLNRAVKEFGLRSPSKILDKLTQIVEETFEKSESQVRDGMDLSLCKYTPKSNTIEYAGANNPLWVISKAETILLDNTVLAPNLSEFGKSLFEVKADKQPIGNYENRKPYTNHIVALNPGDKVYLFTDGFADQFGGPKGKKYKYKPFKKFLLESSAHPLIKQLALIDDEFEKWKGEYEQIDDVCIFSIEM